MMEEIMLKLSLLLSKKLNVEIVSCMGRTSFWNIHCWFNIPHDLQEKIVPNVMLMITKLWMSYCYVFLLYEQII